MSGLVIAADLSALGEAARSLGGAVDSTDHRDRMPSLGHAGADADLGDFHRAMADHCSALSDHVAGTAAALSGYVAAFDAAGN